MHIATVATLLLAAVVVSSLKYEDDPECPQLKAAVEKCASDAGITLEKFDEIVDNKAETADEKTKCLIQCVMVGVKWMNADGKIEAAKEDVPEHYRDMFDACKGVDGKDACDKAFNFHKCYQEKHPH